MISQGLKQLINLDHQYSEKVYEIGSRNQLLGKIVDWITIFYGVGPFALIALIVSKNIILSGFTFGSIMVINYFLVENGLKHFFSRQRPGYNPIRISGQSFPSTHASTTTMFILHICLTPNLYQLTSTAIAATITVYLLILASRVIYGHHYIADIIAGIITGIILVVPFLLLPY